ncbi:hypothetical protein RJ639_005089 [Escallonia herrerae]|uniref:Uncharacterized protein n=1 Tax=Escallonia herrerae TaxID=1293975 RepID=A0AA89AX42_9ASTE|nr:hypothetical protein RJ639_005089 [Escallonia herrerae]
MSEPRSYDRTREARQMDNLFWHLELYFEALDIDNEKDKFYSESIEDMTMINLRQLRQQGSICSYVKVYSAPEMSERQKLCFFIDGLQYWVATELQRREPHNLASAMMIVERLGDFIASAMMIVERLGDFKKDCPHKGKMIVFLKKHKSSKGDSSSSDEEACVVTLQMVNAFVQKSKEKVAKEKKSKKKQSLLYVTVDVTGKTQETLVDTGATHNFMSPRVAEWLGLKPTKDESWFTALNVEERPMKGVIKNVNLRTGGWTWKADFNIIEWMSVLGMDFMEKLSATLNPCCRVMMIAGKEGQLEWMIPLVSKDGADARKGIIVLQLDKGSTLCYSEWQMGLRTYAVDMLIKTVTTDKFKRCLNLIHLLSC